MDASFFSAVRGFKFTSRKHRISDDDAVDRVNSFYVPTLIIIASSVIMTKMYLLGDPIQCWIPPEFHSSWEQFAENYCWVKNTYFVEPNSSIPQAQAIKQQRELNYYQWVPFVLAIQAMLFYLPSFLWKLLNWQSGVQLKTLVSMAANVVQENQKKRDEQAQLVARQIEYTFVEESPERVGVCSRIGRLLRRVLCFGYASSGSYLITVYLVIKLLYLVNVFGQFFLLNAFLGTRYNFFGMQVLHDLINNRNWHETGHFPRITLCDFRIRAIGSDHNYTLQCVLVVNLLNEKIFIFLWFLFAVVAIVTTLDALSWLAWALFPSRRYASIEKYVRVRSAHDALILRRFTREHMKPDGAYVMRLLAQNVGGPVAHDVVKQLWASFCANDKNETPTTGSEEPDIGESERQPILV